MMKNTFLSILKAIVSLLVYGFLLIGVPLLGWGIDDLTEFLAHPVRVIFLLGAIFISIFYAWFMPKNNLSDGVKDESVTRQKVVFVVNIIFYLIMFTLLPYCDRHNLWQIQADNSLRYLGVVIFVIGLIFSAWGPLHLGQQSSYTLTIQQDHKLITDGPFRYIRHPRYLGLSLWILGVSLIYLSIVGLVITTVVTFLLTLRIDDEENLLQQQFGQEWQKYCQQTKRIIPLIY
jgi:protein-S-isoprenylcysteine O-methyltransferase Ste14